MLRVHQVLVNVARMLERFLHCTLRDLVKSHAADAVGRVAILLLLFLLTFVLLAQFFRKVPCDGFAFAVRIRRQINVVRRQCQLFKLGKNFLLAGNDDVLRLEFVVDVDTQRALGQVFHVTKRCFDNEAFAQILLNGLRLAG